MTGSYETRLALEGVEPPEGPGASTLRALTSHVSVRSFKPDAVPPALLRAILTAARSASTSQNLQSYSIIHVSDVAKRKALAEIASGQRCVVESPLFLVFCPDLYRLRKVCERRGYPFVERKTDMFLQAVVDASLAAQNAAVAAEALGMGIVYIGALRNDPGAVAQILGLPPGVFALCGICMGYPAERNALRPRLPQGLTVHNDTYSIETFDDFLDTCDRGRRSAEENVSKECDQLLEWCEHAARRLSRANPLRSRIREALEGLGMEF